MVDWGEMWGEEESRLFYDALDNAGADHNIVNDDWVEFLYHEALWDFDVAAPDRQGAYDAFVDYMMSEYDIDWHEVFDWDDYREAYDAA